MGVMIMTVRLGPFKTLQEGWNAAVEYRGPREDGEVQEIAISALVVGLDEINAFAKTALGSP